MIFRNWVCQAPRKYGWTSRDPSWTSEASGGLGRSKMEFFGGSGGPGGLLDPLTCLPSLGPVPFFGLDPQLSMAKALFWHQSGWSLQASCICSRQSHSSCSGSATAGLKQGSSVDPAAVPKKIQPSSVHRQSTAVHGP